MAKELTPGASPGQPPPQLVPPGIAPDTYTDPATLPRDVRRRILLARDAIVATNLAEAYHQLQLIADPQAESKDPWAKLEGR